MGNKLIIVNQWISRRMFFVACTAGLLGFFHPMSVSGEMKSLTVYLFAYMTFTTSLTTGFRKFISVFKRLWLPVEIITLIHIGVPLLAWVVGHLFYPQDAMMRLGFMVAASIPIAVTAIMWTEIAGGDIAVSIMSVTIDTMIVPFLLPVYFMLVAGQTVAIDYRAMVLQLLWMVTVPSLCGMLLKDFTQGRLDSFAKGAGGVTTKIAIFFVIYMNASLVAPSLDWSLSMAKTLLAVLIMVSSGYLLGYAGSFTVRRRTAEMIPTFIYNVGMRNNSFGMVLALAYFPPAAAIPITLTVLFQQPVAAFVSYLLSRKERVGLNEEWPT